MSGDAALDGVRAIADAVLYEGYLLYPYRASSAKNRSRWQFGVLGPPRATAASFAEEPAMSLQCLLEAGPGAASVTVHLRCLQLQVRSVEERVGEEHRPVEELVVDGRSLLSWDEAVECEAVLPAYDLAGAGSTRPAVAHPVELAGGEEVEPVVDHAGATVGRIVRRRRPLRAEVTLVAEPDDGFVRLTVTVENVHPDEVHGKDEAIRAALIGTHVLVVADGARFVSRLEPPDRALKR